MFIVYSICLSETNSQSQDTLVDTVFIRTAVTLHTLHIYVYDICHASSVALLLCVVVVQKNREC